MRVISYRTTEGRGVFHTITRLSFIVSMAIGTLLAGCDAPNSIVANIDPVEWREAALISIPNADTVTLRDISIFLRYQPIETSRSIPLKVETTTPSGERITESFTLMIPKFNRGEANNYALHESLYRSRVRWREVGNYSMKVSPRKRVTDIEAVGVTITKSNTSKQTMRVRKFSNSTTEER